MDKLLAIFLSLKESTCESTKKIFHFKNYFRFQENLILEF